MVMIVFDISRCHCGQRKKVLIAIYSRCQEKKNLSDASCAACTSSVCCWATGTAIVSGYGELLGEHCPQNTSSLHMPLEFKNSGRAKRGCCSFVHFLQGARMTGVSIVHSLLHCATTIFARASCRPRDSGCCRLKPFSLKWCQRSRLAPIA